MTFSEEISGVFGLCKWLANCLLLCSLVLDRIGEIKFLFGFSDAVDGVNDSSPKDVIGYIQEMIDVFKLKLRLGDYPEDSNMPTFMHKVQNI